MMQIIEMTDKEKLKMYMKLSKKELAKMLIESNKYRTSIGTSAISYQLNNTGTTTYKQYPHTLTATGI